MQDPTKLKLANAKVVFYTGPEDEKAKEFGTSITIAVTPEQEKVITDFCAANKVGKNGDPKKGTANIKEYTNEDGVTTKQFSIKFNDKTQFAGVNNLSQNDLGYGAVVNIIANAWEYKKFGGGVAISAAAIVIVKGSATTNDAALNELLSDLGNDMNVTEDDVVPF